MSFGPPPNAIQVFPPWNGNELEISAEIAPHTPGWDPSIVEKSHFGGTWLCAVGVELKDSLERARYCGGRNIHRPIEFCNVPATKCTLERTLKVSPLATKHSFPDTERVSLIHGLDTSSDTRLFLPITTDALSEGAHPPQAPKASSASSHTTSRSRNSLVSSSLRVLADEHALCSLRSDVIRSTLQLYRDLPSSRTRRRYTSSPM